LATRFEKEILRQVPGLAKELARIYGYAELETHRIRQAGRVAEETAEATAMTLMNLRELERDMTRRYPDAAADISEMIQGTCEFVKRHPWLAEVAFVRRFYNGF